MSKINLTEEELTKLLEAVNAGAEPTPEIAGKLFPTLMEKLGQEGKFDFETLNRIKIPTIEYAGKRSEGVILASAAALGQSAPLQVVRSFGDAGEDGWRNLIIQGDNLQFLKTAYLNQDPLIKDKIKGKVKLIYVDPPFATKSDFQGGDGTKSYSDKVATAEFIENLRERFIYMREALSEDGAIYVHCDWRMNSAMRMLLDEVFGYNNYRNEIRWRRQPVRGAKATGGQFARNSDSILFYSKNSKWCWNGAYKPYDEKFIKTKFRPDADGRLFRDCDLGDYSEDSIKEFERQGKIYITSSGKKRLIRFLDEEKGESLGDIWIHIPEVNSMAEERCEYPTQKPEQLIETIVKASSNPGDLVMDVFAGSGTTAATAEKLGRRWIACDFGKHAIYTMQKRILRIAESKAFDATKKDAKYKQCPKALAIASVGAYDFSRIMNLRENKCAYISFVLALFGIPKEKKDYVAKYKLDHIYAEKDGDPVEIFPVWNDQFLYNVRIDQEYLTGL